MAFKQLKLWFDKDLAVLLSEKIKAIEPKFESKKFVQVIDQEVQSLELKDRVAFFARQLHIQLDEDYKTGLPILLKILGPENVEETGMFTNYYWVMPIAKYVEDYGLEDYSISMNALKEITKRNTSEYAIRPYLSKFPKKTLKQLTKWSLSKNVHVRRLASEGVRPRLPWAKKMQEYIVDPSPVLPILENLKDDPSRYVQKSVANCINDILKDNESIGKRLLESWVLKATKERKWVMKHAIRNLIKRKDPWVSNIL